MTALVYGLIEAGTSGWTNAMTIGALAGRRSRCSAPSS